MKYDDRSEGDLGMRCARVVVWIACAAILVNALALQAWCSAEGEHKAIRRTGGDASGVFEKPPSPDRTDPVTRQDKNLAVSGAPAALPSSGPGDLYAVTVGVSKYKNPAIPQLNVSAKDAIDFAEFLKTQRDFFRNTFVTVLTDEKATKYEVERQIYYELRKAGKDDTIVLFLSGHGTIDPKRPGQFFFLTHDADPEVLELTAVNMSGLKMFSELDCQRVVLVADACHAGGFSKWRTKMGVVPLKNFLQDFSSSAGRVVITSSRPEEYSLEGVRFPNSVFTHFFLEGLAGAADANGDGVVTVNEAYHYVYEKTKSLTEGAQHPQFEGAIEGVFPLAATTGLRSRPPTSLSLRANPPQAEVFVAGKFVGKTNAEGALYLKYLPVDRPITVKLRKEGWRDMEIGPFVLSKERMELDVDPVTLAPCTGALEIKTDPGRVRVKVDGQDVGITSNNGLLLVQGVQVALPHQVEFKKAGYEDRVSSVTIPPSHEGNTFCCVPVKLEKPSKGKTSTSSQNSPRSSESTYSSPQSRSGDEYAPRRSGASESTDALPSQNSSGSGRDYGL